MENKITYGKEVASVGNKKSYDMFLVGEIGSGEGMINGHIFARELNYLLSNDYYTTIKINSFGGDVAHMKSIISEIASSNKSVSTVNVGIAYSSAAIILLMGDKRSAIEGSETMVHSSRYVNEKGEIIPVEQLDELSQKHLQHTNDTFSNLLVNKAGFTKAEAETALSKDTLYIGEEQMKYGIVQNIIPLNKKIDRSEFATLSPKLRMVACANYYNINQQEVNNTNTNDKKENKIMEVNEVQLIAASIGLPKETAVIGIVQNFTDTKKKLEEAESKVKELQSKLDEIEKENLVSLVNEKAEKGFIAKEAIPSTIAVLAKCSIEERNAFLGGLKAVITPIDHKPGSLDNDGFVEKSNEEIQKMNTTQYREYLQDYNKSQNKNKEK